MHSSGGSRSTETDNLFGRASNPECAHKSTVVWDRDVAGHTIVYAHTKLWRGLTYICSITHHRTIAQSDHSGSTPSYNHAMTHLCGVPNAHRLEPACWLMSLNRCSQNEIKQLLVTRDSTHVGKGCEKEGVI